MNNRKVVFIDLSKMSFKDACYVLGDKGKKIYKNYVIVNCLIVVVCVILSTSVLLKFWSGV